MNRLRMAFCMALAGIVLACCAVVLTRHGEPARASITNVAAGEDDPGLLKHAIWDGQPDEDTWEFRSIQFREDAPAREEAWTFQTIQFREETAPGASQEAPGVRLLDYDVPPAGRYWAWALFLVVAAGFFLFLHRPKPHGRIVAVRVRQAARPAPRRRRRG